MKPDHVLNRLVHSILIISVAILCKQSNFAYVYVSALTFIVKKSIT